MPSDINVIGVVTSASGDVYAAVNGELRLLETGSPVYQHDKLVTGSGATLEVRFQDDTLLSQGQGSTISIDDYIFDSSDSSGASELLFGMAQGTFRMVTGKIAEQNPERFKIGTPLATIGIRGTTTVHEISADGEKHGIEQIHSGKALVIQGNDGSVRMIADSRELVDISATGTMSPVRPMSMQEFASFRDIAPSAIRQEQEIIEERDQESQLEGEEQQGEPDNGDESSVDGTPVTDESPGGGDLNPPENEQEEGVEQHLLQVNNSAEDAGIAAPETSFSDPSGNLPIQPGATPASEFSSRDNSSELLDDFFIPELGNSTTLPDPTIQSVVWGPDSDNSPKGLGIAQIVRGLDGNETVNSERGDGILPGVVGNDIVSIVYGNNVLDSGDVFTGDANDNTFVYGGGNDSIDGGDGLDTLDLSKFFTASGYEVGLSDDYVRIIDTSVQVDIENIECIIGSNHNDTIGGSDASETFFGGAGADYLEGSGNTDTLYGEAGDDNLEGGAGNDFLFGGSGSDFLMGGLGTDTLTGGADADIFYFDTPSSSEGGDTIADFLSGEDKIKYSATNFAPVNDLYKTDAYDGVSGDASGAQFVYDTTESKLYYDADGSGTGESGVLIATFTNDADISGSDIESF